MAVKILNVIVTKADTDVSWQSLNDDFTDWNDVQQFSDWNDVARLGTESPLTVVVGTPIKITVQAVDVAWEHISNNFQDWSAVENNFSNWREILNYH